LEVAILENCRFTRDGRRSCGMRTNGTIKNDPIIPKKKNEMHRTSVLKNIGMVSKRIEWKLEIA